MKLRTRNASVLIGLLAVCVAILFIGIIDKSRQPQLEQLSNVKRLSSEWMQQSALWEVLVIDQDRLIRVNGTLIEKTANGYIVHGSMGVHFVHGFAEAVSEASGTSSANVVRWIDKMTIVKIAGIKSMSSQEAGKTVIEVIASIRPNNVSGYLFINDQGLDEDWTTRVPDLCVSAKRLESMTFSCKFLTL